MRWITFVAGGVALGLLLGLGWWEAGPPLPELRWDADPRSPAYGSVEARGLGRDVLARLRGATGASREAVLAVYAGADTTMPPVLGDYRVEGRVLRFVPQFPLRPGLGYRARLDPGAGRVPVEVWFTPPEPPGAPETAVSAVYPSGDVVPANLLRWYIHFSAPMSAGAPYPHVRLLDEAGREVAGAFLEMDHALWDPARTRLTLLLDPGRIKRGIGAHADEGMPLEPGRRYRLVVDAGWRDARGRPLAQGFEHAFETTAPDRTPPAVEGWEIAAPAAGTDAPLVVRFAEPLDRALLDRLIRVEDATGQRVEGQVIVDAGETAWRLTPARPWTAGAYTLRVHAALEDRAGNSLQRVFDLDLHDPAQAPGDRAEVTRTFHVSPEAL